MSYVIHTKRIYDRLPLRYLSSPINHHTGPRITASGSHLSFLSVSLRHVLETIYLFSNYPKIFICKLKYQKLGPVGPDKQAINLEWPYRSNYSTKYSQRYETGNLSNS